MHSGIDYDVSAAEFSSSAHILLDYCVVDEPLGLNRREKSF